MSGWSQERIDVLTKLWGEGVSAGAIARCLGGVTRSAVLGKVHRLGLTPRATVSRTRASMRQTGGRNPHWRRQTKAAIAKAAPKPRRKPTFSAEPLPNPQAPLGPTKTLIELGHNDCRFPFGDGPFSFCGCPQEPGLPYCEAHARLCYEAPTVKTRKREKVAA